MRHVSDDAAADLLTACNSLCNRAQRLIMANIKSYAASCDRVDQSSVTRTSSHWSGTPAAAVPSATKNVEIAHQAEMKLWLDLKKFKETNDKNVMQYVCGFYAGLLHMAMITVSGSADSHFVIQPLNLLSSMSISMTVLFHPDQEAADVRLMRSLLYNLLIRLGDVNRYLKNIPVARSYYNQARHLHPGRGHAFNQLALICSDDPVAQVYMYVRACCSIVEPVSIASHNLKSSSTRLCHSDQILAALLSDGDNQPFPAHRVTEWIQVLVIAIFAKRTALIVKPLLDQALSCLRRKVGCNPFSSNRFEGHAVEQNSVNLLSAVSVLVDYADSSEGRIQSLPALVECETELKKIQIEVISVMAQSDDFAIGSIRNACTPDYQLVGFQPLRHAHEKLDFDGTSGSSAAAATGSDPSSLKNNEFIFLIKKLRAKIDQLLHVIADKGISGGNRNPLPVLSAVTRLPTDSPLTTSSSKAPVRSRNAALKSILSGN